MKKFLIILCILGALYYGRNAIQSHEINKTANVFITQALTDISKTWSEADFKKNADASLANAESLGATLASYRKLGKLKGTPDCSLDSFDKYNYPEKAVVYVSATYVCKAVFDNAPADIQLILRRYNENQWKIEYFALTSPYFTPSKR